MSDPKLPFYSNYCKCAACDKYFNSVAGFTMHRIGKPEERRCRTPAEMTKRGMSVNKRGYWITEARELHTISPAASAEQPITENQ